MKAEVLNGTVEVGDRVAVGVRDGNCGGIRAGVVVEIIPHALDRWDYGAQRRVPCIVHSLRVQVEHSSGKLPKRPQLYGTDNTVKLG